jgi:hypothetical protein
MSTPFSTGPPQLRKGIGTREAGLVLDLIAPALGLVNADELMPVVLDLPSERARADDAGIELEILELIAGLLQQARPGIEPAGIGPVARIGGLDAQILGREDALPDEPRDAALRLRTIGEHGRDTAEEIEDGVGPAAGRQRRA